MIRFFINGIPRAVAARPAAPGRGFTLVELAVVIAIIGLLLGGLLVPLSTQIEQQRVSETQRRLNDIREAIVGFALANGRLPCPATPNVASGAAGAGTENLTGTSPNRTCGVLQGVVPWADLGTPETDAWDRRFTYRVTASFGDDIALNTVTPPGACTDTSAQSSFALCSDGDNKICNSAPCNASSTNTVADKVPAVIVSHGKNGSGAYLPSGLQVAGVAGNEAENSDVEEYFISQTPDPGFDDIVTWMPNGILKARMVSAGKLP